MFKSVIFDFNGTILLDQIVQKESWIDFISELVGRCISEEEYYKDIHAINNKSILEYYLKREITKEEVEYLGNRKERKYRDLCIIRKSEVVLNKGITHFLDTLIKNGININIATGAPYDNMQFAFAMYNLDKWFDIKTIVCDDGTLKGKPDPDVYLRSLKAINAKGYESIAFEDSIVGVQSALNANIKEVYLVDGFDKIKEEILNIGNRDIKVFKNFIEVERYLFDGSYQ